MMSLKSRWIMERLTREYFVFCVLLLLTFGLASCHRSAQFLRDEEVNKFEDQGVGGGALNKISSTQKIENLVQPKKHVVVFDFWNDTPLRVNDLGVFAANELKRGLVLTQKVIISKEDKTDLGTEDFIEGDHVKVSQLIREGRRLGVSVLVIGRMAKVAFRQRGDDVGLFRQRQSLAAVDVEMKLFDVQAGREILSSKQSGEASVNALAAFENNDMESPTYRAELIKVALREAVSKFVRDVIISMDKLAWQGRIAKITGPKIFINAGRASGLLTGDILRVLNPGEDVYDPTSGAYLGRAQGQLKGTLEITDFLGTDAAVAQVHTGGNFAEGDFVQLY